MACKLIWSPAARDDLRDIVRFIVRDNPQRAESFGYGLMRRADILHPYAEALVKLFWACRWPRTKVFADVESGTRN
jgi:hypothetical protein